MYRNAKTKSIFKKQRCLFVQSQKSPHGRQFTIALSTTVLSPMGLTVLELLVQRLESIQEGDRRYYLTRGIQGGSGKNGLSPVQNVTYGRQFTFALSTTVLSAHGVDST